MGNENGFEYKLNDNISIYEEIDSSLISFFTSPNIATNELVFPKQTTISGFPSNKRIKIGERWFDIIPKWKLYRMRNADGYYRVIYIQINWETTEYYIGKANRPTWRQLMRYSGSGLRFVNSYQKHKEQFERYFIASCSSAEETEKLESEIITQAILADDLCLNLVAGGGGTSKHPTKEETNEKKRQWMLNHPEQYAAMLEGARKSFRSGETPQFKARVQKLKETMSDEKYRVQFRNRIANWRENNPEEYKEALKKSHDIIKQESVQKKRKESFQKWVKDHPAEFEQWQRKLIESRTSDEANRKRGDSIKKFNLENPEAAKENTRKRLEAAMAVTNRPISMMDLDTGEVLREFESQHDAARWLVEQGIAKNTKCVATVGAVCLYYQNPDGRKRRLKAYGYKWVFRE